MRDRFAASVLPILLAHLGATAAGAASPPPSCTRVHPTFGLEVHLPHRHVVDTARADLDGDGIPDLVVLAANSPLGSRGPEPPPAYTALRVIATSDARLEEKVLFRVGGPAHAGHAPDLLHADLDGDGLRDLLVARYLDPRNRADARLDPFLASATGAFEPGPPLDAGDGIDDWVLGDFDGDGRDDVAVVGDGPVAIWRLLPEEGWRKSSAGFAGDLVRVTAYDVDGDADDDLVGYVWPGRRTLAWLLGDPAAPLSARRAQRLDFRAFGDLRAYDADGRAPHELLVGEWVDDPGWNVRLRALRHEDPGHFGELWRLDLPRRARGYMPFDLDGDSRRDIVVGFAYASPSWPANAASPNPWPGVGTGYLLLHGRGESAPEFGAQSIGAPSLVDLRDVSGDGVVDAVLLAEPGRQGLVWYEGRPGPEFVEPGRYAPAVVQATSSHLAGQADDDGRVDLLAVDRSSPSRVTSLLSAGDGTFEAAPWSELPNPSIAVYYHDVDGDGFSDVLALLDDFFGRERAVKVAYGRGDGTFEPFANHAPGRRFVGLTFGDLDGDGDDDVLATYQRRWPIFVEGREWATGPAHSFPATGCSPSIRPKLIDVDGDGRDDPIHAQCLSEYPVRDRDGLVWRRTLPLGEGGRELFGPARTILEWDAARGSLRGLHAADLDGDGSQDLLVQIGRLEGSALETHTLKGDGTGRYVPLWTGIVPAPDGDTLVDADLDGTLDLVSVSPALQIWRGDGSGRFRVDGARAWYTERDPILADFTDDAIPDAVAHFQLTLEPWRALTRSEGRVLASDEAPPAVELWVHPLVAEREAPTAFDARWRVVTTVEDACDARPATLVRRLDLPAAAPDTPVAFRVSGEREMRIYADPPTGSRRVVLLGPDEARARARWQAAQAEGGFALERIHVLRLNVSALWGPNASRLGDGALVPDGFRLARRVLLSATRVEGMSATAPGADVTFLAVGEDDAGRRAETAASFAAILDAYCERPDADDVVCP